MAGQLNAGHPGVSGAFASRHHITQCLFQAQYQMSEYASCHRSDVLCITGQLFWGVMVAPTRTAYICGYRDGDAAF